MLHGKNDFAEISKNLPLNTDKIILSDYQNNYTEKKSLIIIIKMIVTNILKVMFW